VPLVHHEGVRVRLPANLFAPTADGGILFNYEECFECGTATWSATPKGTDLDLSDGGHGVVFHHG